jgi:hypothetical protein
MIHQSCAGFQFQKVDHWKIPLHSPTSMKQLEFMTHKRIAEIIHEIRAAASSNLCYITAQAAATVSSRETSYKRAYPIT